MLCHAGFRVRGYDSELSDQALDHITNIAATAIWLTLIFDNSRADGGEKLQASGYFADDYFKVDPHFGTEEESRELVEKAHDRGLYVFPDGFFGPHDWVCTHSPSGFRINSTPSLCDRGEECGAGNVKYLESLDYFKEVATYWIDKFDIDGWRFDQACRLCQNGHNYWCEISQALRELCDKRSAGGLLRARTDTGVKTDWSGKPQFARPIGSNLVMAH